ncbi:MAG: gliding motility-associated C-terminal domain-containing protein, partial [Bacteroidales bacterium]|nr:gliding motility-associated C-terminal domain-containing protein [Bacteroidales bacterium]
QAANGNSECQGIDPDLNTDYLAWLANNGGAVAADLCGNNVTWTNNAASQSWSGTCTQTITITFTATDDCDNASTTQAAFTITDTTAPVWVNEPADLTVECDGNGNTAQLTAWLNSFSGSDVCGTATVTHDYVAANFVEACGATGYVDVEFTLTDACGNDISKIARFTIEDTTDPVWVNEPTDLTVECDGDGNTAQLNAWLASFSGSDVCGTAVVTHDYVAANFVAACGATGYVDVEFTLTDACGNDISKTVRFTIEDTTDPVWVNEPTDLTVECDGDGNTAQLNAWLASFSGSDVCGTATVTHDYVADNFVAECGATGYVDVEFTLTDACGNDISKTVRFTIEDTTDPVWVNEPADLTVECDGDGNTAQLTAWLASFSGSDVCGSATVTHDYDPDNFVALCGATGYVDVEFTLTDACDNAISKTVRFTIEDTTDPEWTAEPADLTVECDGDGNTAQLTSWLASFSGSDICGTANVTHDYVATNFVAACGATGYVDVEFTLTDACGNDISQIARFTIIDTIDPEWTVEPADMTVECDGAGNTAQLTAWLAGFSGSDICGTANVTHDYVAANFVAECGATGYVDVEFTLTDACGNDISKIARFTIEDTSDPVWVVEPADMTVECDGDGNTAQLNAWLASFSGSDVCGTANVTHDYDADNFVDACGATGYVEVEFTLTDACGNEISKTARFTIEDTTDPVFTVVPQDLTVECDGLGNEAELTAWLANVDATDVCGEVTITHDFIALSDGCGATGSAQVTWTATDACGNFATTSATFTIVDTTPPVIVCPESPIVVVIPATETVYIAQDGEFDYVSIEDICGDVTATHNLVHTDLSSLDGYEFPLGDTEVIWTVTDDCGNISECSFIVTIYAPSLVVTKTAEPQVYSQVGEEITYTITVSNTGNATLSDVVVTDPLTGLDTTIETLLPGETVTFTETYVITYDDLFNGSVVNTAFAIGLDPEDNEVTESDSETIYVLLDDLQLILVSQTDVLCFGDETGSAEIQIVGGLYPYTIVWYTDPEQTGLVATNLPAGTYVVMVTDALGQTVQLTVVITQPAAPLNITYQVTHVLCNGEATGAIDVEVFGGTEPYTFLWSNSATTQNLDGLTAGNYSAVITDDHGCLLEFDVTITQPDALYISDISIEGVLCMVDKEGSVQFTVGGGVAPYTFLWSNQDTTAGLVDVPGGEYWVVITDANGCELIYDFFVPYEVEDCEFRIPQGLSPDGDGFNDTWEINGLVRFPNNVVRIYNRWGTLVYEAAPYPNNWDGRPNRGLGSGNDRGILPTGTYFYVIELQPGMKPLTGYIYLVTD